MSKSILDTQKGVCFICGRYGFTEKHHIMQGVANRRLSEEDGLCVYLCFDHHNRPPDGVHFNKENMLRLHQTGQKAYENKLIEDGMSEEEARKAFMERYGKNYL